MTNKRIKNKKEVSETGEILRIVNYIFLLRGNKVSLKKENKYFLFIKYVL